MVVPKAAVDRYLSRELDDHTWAKDLPPEELDAALADLQPPPDLWPGLHHHQRVAFLLGVAYPGFALWLDMGCVDGSTEYLSPEGWVPIRDYAGGRVAQYDPHTRRAEFVEPHRYIDRPCEHMHHFRTARGCDQMVSPGHKMLVVGGGVHHGPKCTHWADWKHSPVTAYDVGRNEWFFDAVPEEVAGRGHVRFETTFALEGPGLPLTDAQLRLQVAVHADGHLKNKSTVAVKIKKERKRRRLRQLLGDAGVDYRAGAEGDGFEVFEFRPPVHTKFYGSEWYACSLAQKRIICEEVGHWDGGFSRAGAASFFTRSRSCADFIQFCFSSTGRRAYRSDPKPRPNGKKDYSVHAIGNGRTTNLAHLGSHATVPAPDGRMYCFEVPTGYLVFRRSGNVFVSGNSGKTLVALELLRYWWQVRGLRRALVFVTSDKAFPTWERQVEEFEIGLPRVTLEGSSEEKWARLREAGEGLALVTYPGAVAMASRRVAASGRGKKERMELDPERVAELGEWAGALVLDESTRCGNHRSLTFQLVNQLRHHTPIRYALAGRPFGRDPSLLHAQYLLVDGGETLGETLGLFRAAFFRERKIPWDPSGRAREYKFRREMEPELSRMLQHRSITYTSDECVDLPEVVPVVEEVSFTAEAETYYRRVVERLRVARGNYREMENVFTRMRQVSSGFVGMYDDETGERAEIEFADNPKLDRLLELVGDMPADAKAVVFYDFTWSGRRLTRELERVGMAPAWLWSGTSDYRAELERFCTDPRCRVAVINSRVGAYSLDGLQHAANYLVFYESPVSVIDREQAERRVRRQGQPHRVFQYDLVVRGSLDRRILDYHQEGESLFDALLRDPESALEDGDDRSAGDGGATGLHATRGRTRAA